MNPVPPLREFTKDNESGITPDCVLHSTSTTRQQARLALGAIVALAFCIQLEEGKVIPAIAAVGSVTSVLFHYTRSRANAVHDAITHCYQTDRPTYDAIMTECRSNGGKYASAADIVDANLRVS